MTRSCTSSAKLTSGNSAAGAFVESIKYAGGEGGELDRHRPGWKLTYGNREINLPVVSECGMLPSNTLKFGLLILLFLLLPSVGIEANETC